MDSVQHFELPCNDLARARRFYSEAFGWSLFAVGKGYLFAGTTEMEANGRPKKVGAVNGALVPKQGVNQAPVLFLRVASLADAARKVALAGGSVAGEPVVMPGAGRLQHVRDTEGTILALWEQVAAPSS